ncbi:MAG TPA: PfkB family carbohydrate kinase [Solirubrobacteraceae bacterium]|nr:PfkB family carbohydrate kinase [Solirubrobacteraceae bacterium]
MHSPRYHYTAVGHVTIDVFDDGSARPGGSAFYAALQAARLGLRALVITRGVASEIEALLAPYAHELAVRVLDGEHTTTLLTSGADGERSQRVRAWAGPIADQLELDTHILHLAPVARESPASWRGRPAFVGLTPQGLARAWDGPTGTVTHVTPDADAAAIARRCNALVVSDHERASCAALIAAARAAGAVVAITAGARPTTLLAPGAGERTLAVAPVTNAVDDLGAGDVFAAAFFIALSEGQDVTAAARFASAAAAVRMRGLGAGAIGGRADVQERLTLAARGR